MEAWSGGCADGSDVRAVSSAALFLKHINQLFDSQFGIRGKATKLKLDMNRDFAPTLKKQMVGPERGVRASA